MAGKKKTFKAKEQTKSTPKIEKKVPSEPGIDMLTRLENALSTRKYWLAAGIFIVSMVLNSIYYQQSKDSPLKALSKWENSDMAFFDESAKLIAAGNWRCDTVLHPFHSWHNTLASQYFDQYPETAGVYYGRHASPAGGSDSLAARREWINEIYHGKVFHQEPLYVYLMAVTYRLFGVDPNWIYLWQLLLGALTNVLVFLIGRRYFGSLPGLLAAVIVMLSGPIMVFHMTLLRTSLTVFLTALLLYCYQKMLDNNDRKSQVIFGAVSGISLLAQSYFMLFLLPAIAWYVLENRRDMKTTSRSLGYILGTLMLVLAPLFIRNIKVGVPMTAMASHGAINLILFNSSNSYPLEANYIHYPSLVQLLHDSGSNLFSVAATCLNSFDGLSSIMRLSRDKINGLFMWFEVPNNVSYYMYKEFSPLLEALPAPYWLIAPLGICGLLFGFWRFRWRFLPFFIMFLASASPLFISSSLARLRAPFVVLMTLLAAFFIIDFTKNLLHLKWKETLAGIMLVALSWFYTGNILDKRFFTLNVNDIWPVYTLNYKERLLKLEKENKTGEYLMLTTELISYIPDYFLKVRSTHKAFSSNEADCCRSVAKLLIMHATILNFTGNKAEGAKFGEQATVLRNISDNFDKKFGR